MTETDNNANGQPGGQGFVTPPLRPPSSALLDELARIVGARHLLTAPDDIGAYLTDARRQYTRSAPCVVRPGSTEEVAAIVGACGRHKVGIVPQGGNTGLSGGSVPVEGAGQIVLSLGRLNRILHLDPLNNTITVQAGCILAQIQEAAREAVRLFPLSLAAEGSCQIGGNLSTNAGGVNVLRYGNAREQVLGLEVVLPDGRVWEGLRGLRKDNTGYDLKQIFVGAEGTLGIITAAVLRLRPLPSARTTAWAAVATPEHAVQWLQRLGAQLGDRLSAFELISRACLDAVLQHRPQLRSPIEGAHAWHVLVELVDSTAEAELQTLALAAFEEALQDGLVVDVALASSEAQADSLWSLRESIPAAQFRNVKHDVSVPVSRVPELLRDASDALERAFPGVLPYAFGHLGDGNIHLNIGMRDPDRTESLIAEKDKVNRIVFDCVDRLGGSISAEHGIGQLRRGTITDYKSPLEIDLMRGLKRTFDPLGIMNPGKVV